jgi:hypothetical protein
VAETPARRDGERARDGASVKQSSLLMQDAKR